MVRKFCFFFVNTITCFAVLSFETENSQRSAKKAVFLPKRAEGVTDGPNIESINQKTLKCSLLTKTPDFLSKKDEGRGQLRKLVLDELHKRVGVKHCARFCP